MKPGIIKSFRDLAQHLKYEGPTPLRYDPQQSESILHQCGLKQAPRSYVEYFSHIGYVIWECFPDSLEISPPDSRSGHGIKRRITELDETYISSGLTANERKQLIPFGAIDRGILLCWDLSRIAGDGEPAVVGISEKRVSWGENMFDFLLNYWLVGLCGAEKVFTDIPDQNLSVLALSDC